MQVKQVFANSNEREDVDIGQFRYSPFCGAPLLLKVKGGRLRPACPGCGFVQYRNPIPGVVVVIERDGLETIEADVVELPTLVGLSPEADINELLIK